MEDNVTAYSFSLTCFHVPCGDSSPLIVPENRPSFKNVNVAVIPSASVNDHVPIIGCEGTDTGREAGTIVEEGAGTSVEGGAGTVSVTIGGTVVAGRGDCVVVWGAEAHPAKHTARIMKEITHPDIRIPHNFSLLPALLME